MWGEGVGGRGCGVKVWELKVCKKMGCEGEGGRGGCVGKGGRARGGCTVIQHI